jgi:thiol-disulfide isomerase/thioredoxin
MRSLLICVLLSWSTAALAEPTTPAPAATPENQAPATARSTVADFTLSTLKGDTVKLSDFKGKVVVISFWASWCKPCKQELQHLDKMAKSRSDDMVLLAVNTDDPSTRSEARKYIRRKKIKCQVPLDADGAVMADLNPRGSLPFSVYIDRKGGQHSTHDGFSSGDEVKIQKLVDILIAEK